MATEKETFVAVIPGSGGRVRTELHIVEFGPVEFILRFTYGGESYQAMDDKAAGQSSVSLSEEHDVSGGPITCSKTSLLALGTALERWLETGELFSWDSGGDYGPLLILSLCRSETSAPGDKATFTGTYENSASFYSSWIYTVDQSCLRDAAEVLQSVGARHSVH